MVLCPKPEVFFLNYHTPSIPPHKADKRFENFSNPAKSASAHRPSEHGGRPASNPRGNPTQGQL